MRDVKSRRQRPGPIVLGWRVLCFGIGRFDSRLRHWNDRRLTGRKLVPESIEEGPEGWWDGADWCYSISMRWNMWEKNKNIKKEGSLPEVWMWASEGLKEYHGVASTEGRGAAVPPVLCLCFLPDAITTKDNHPMQHPHIQSTVYLYHHHTPPMLRFRSLKPRKHGNVENCHRSGSRFEGRRDWWGPCLEKGTRELRRKTERRTRGGGGRGHRHSGHGWQVGGSNRPWVLVSDDGARVVCDNFPDGDSCSCSVTKVVCVCQQPWNVDWGGERPSLD